MPTLKDYRRRFQEFQKWCQLNHLEVTSTSLLDLALVEFLEELFDQDRGVNDGVRVVAATRFFLPNIAKALGHQSLPRAVRALKGWNLASPQLQRMPIPVEVMGAMAGVLLCLHKPNMALRLFFQFVTYLRPGECSQIKGKHLIPPQKRNSSHFGQWAVLLNPIEDLIPGKTNIFDASVILDSDLWMGEFLAMRKLSVGNNDNIWVFRQSQSFSGDVCHDHSCTEDRRSGVNFVCSPTWGGHTRRHFQKTHSARGETTWPLGQRQQPQAVCEGGQTSVGACKGSSSSSRVWHKHPESTANVDRKTSHDSKATVWNPTITKRMRNRPIINSAGLPSLNGADLLKAHFRKVMTKFKGSCRRVFLDIFSGVGGIHTYLSKKGYPVIAVDVCL